MAQAGVHQKSEAQRQIGLVREIIDGLRTAVFVQLEIVFGQVWDDLAVLIANGGQHADGFDLDRNLRRRFLRALQDWLWLPLLLRGWRLLLGSKFLRRKRPGRKEQPHKRPIEWCAASDLRKRDGREEPGDGPS